MSDDAALTAETERRLAAIRARFPDRFAAADLERIEGRIARSQRQAATLRNAPLTNGDGPFFSPVAMPRPAADE